MAQEAAPAEDACPGSGSANGRHRVSIFEAAEAASAWAVDRRGAGRGATHRRSLARNLTLARRAQLFVGPVLNRGSHALVYRGQYSQEPVAIKVLRIEKMATQRVYSDFVNECELLRKMVHPHVLRFVGVCFEPPNLCIVTEFMPNGSLHDVLHGDSSRPGRPGPPPSRLSPARALRYAEDITSAMAYLHEQKVIHRDLKSANLLLSAEDAVKVADFGVARNLSPKGEMTAETGTYRWMAPEVILHQKYNEKVDVYSFGIILFELFTSTVPYAHLSPLEAAAAVVREGLRPEVPPDVHPAVAALASRCWSTLSADRPSFAAILDMMPALNAALAPTNPAQRQPSWRGGGLLGGLLGRKVSDGTR